MTPRKRDRGSAALPEGNKRGSRSHRPPITCPHCDQQWTGLLSCHCGGKGGCHRSFTSLSAFDKHRTGSHAYSTRRCLDPATLLDKNGEPVLVPADKPWAGWSLPGSWRGPEEDD